MHLQQRINLMVRLKNHMVSADPSWAQAKQQAYAENNWFVPEFIDRAIQNMVAGYLDSAGLESWAHAYGLKEIHPHPKNIGLVMAGNIPLVGFHDFLSIFISGHRQTIKPSSKDQALIRHLVDKLHSWEPSTRSSVHFSDRLIGCDAYIATGSNNSGRYFEYYFGKFPHLIRRNRSSIAILSGQEEDQDLAGLADDICLYFGLGCRNVSKIWVPRNYPFNPLLKALDRFGWMSDHPKFRNNYDYQLAVLQMNQLAFQTNGTLLLVENRSLHSPISVLNFEYYDSPDSVLTQMAQEQDLQCILGNGRLPFGRAQCPGLMDYADGADTLKFLLSC
jgi:hypothetical protein